MMEIDELSANDCQLSP